MRHPWQIPSEVWKEVSVDVIVKNCAARVFIHVSVELEVLNDLPQSLVPYTIECFLEVDEVLVEDTLMLQIFLYQQFYFVLLYFFLVESLPGFHQHSISFG